MNGDNGHPIEGYQNLLNNIRAQYEKSIAAQLLGTSRLVVPAYERSAERLILGVGATTGLLLPNVASLSVTFTPDAVRAAIGLFGVSILLGLLSLIRGRAALIAMMACDVTMPAVAKELAAYDAALMTAANEYQLPLDSYITSPPSTAKVMSELKQAAPFWTRRQIDKGAKKGALDPFIRTEWREKVLGFRSHTSHSKWRARRQRYRFCWWR